MRSFRECLKAVRLHHGYTQKQIAEALGITERAYQYYESGTRDHSLYTIIRIADTMDVSIDFLVGRTDCPDMLIYDEDGNTIIIDAMKPKK